jgi:predicted Fe-Mo cluster-binding NifX family protein
MKIAVACEGKNITQHFGHCENFTFFETEGNKIIGSESLSNPGHRPGVLPKFVSDNGAKVIIAGGMGGGAVELFNEADIEVIVGAQGDAGASVTAYLAGELVSTGSVCHEHSMD